MDIRPTDLGLKRCVSLVQRRAMPYAQQAGAAAQAPMTPGRIGPLGRQWLKGLEVDDETGGAILYATRGVTANIVGGIAGGFGGGFGGPALGMLSGGIAVHGSGLTLLTALGSVSAVVGAGGIIAGLLTAPRSALRRWITTALNETEIEALLGEATEPLEKAFLGLVREAVRIQGAPEKAAQEVRGAIRAVGEAIAALPPLSSPADEALDAEALRADAQALRQKALAEADPVVSESLARRADALDQQASAVGHSGQALRRSVALREELSAQIEALRLGLVAYYAGSPTDERSLTQLAASARSVAGEATALSRATAELDAGPQALVAGRR